LLLLLSISLVGYTAATIIQDRFLGSNCTGGSLYSRNVYLEECEDGVEFNCLPFAYFTTSFCPNTNLTIDAGLLGGDLYRRYNLTSPYVYLDVIYDDPSCTQESELQYNYYTSDSFQCYNYSNGLSSAGYQCDTDGFLQQIDYSNVSCQGNITQSQYIAPSDCIGQFRSTCFLPPVNAQAETVYSDSSCTNVLYTHIDLETNCTVASSGCVATSGGYKISSCSRGSVLSDFQRAINYPAYVEVQYTNSTYCSYSSKIRSIYFRAVNKCVNGVTYLCTFFDYGDVFEFYPSISTYSDTQCTQGGAQTSQDCFASVPPTQATCINGVIPSFVTVQLTFNASNYDCETPKAMIFTFGTQQGICDPNEGEQCSPSLNNGVVTYSTTTCIDAQVNETLVASVLPNQSYFVATYYSDNDCQEFYARTYYVMDNCYNNAGVYFQYACNDSKAYRVEYSSSNCNSSTIVDSVYLQDTGVCLLDSVAGYDYQCVYATAPATTSALTTSSLTTSSLTTSSLTSPSSTASATTVTSPITSGRQNATTATQMTTGRGITTGRQTTSATSNSNISGANGLACSIGMMMIAISFILIN